MRWPARTGRLLPASRRSYLPRARAPSVAGRRPVGAVSTPTMRTRSSYATRAAWTREHCRTMGAARHGPLEGGGARTWTTRRRRRIGPSWRVGSASTRYDDGRGGLTLSSPIVLCDPALPVTMRALLLRFRLLAPSRCFLTVAALPSQARPGRQRSIRPVARSQANKSCAARLGSLLGLRSSRVSTESRGTRNSAEAQGARRTSTESAGLAAQIVAQQQLRRASALEEEEHRRALHMQQERRRASALEFDQVRTSRREAVG